MKRSHLLTVGIVAISTIAPAIAFAQFGGPPPSPPPTGNAPGVIWNTKGTSAVQDAQMNIMGSAQMGTVKLLQTPVVNFFDNIKLENGRAFRVDSSAASTFYMGNWSPSDGSQKPLSFTVNGGLKIDSIPTAGGLGSDGRIQADKFCFNPGAAGNCITSWPTGGGGGGTGAFVSKSGDSMSGSLTITSATGGTFGVDASAPAGSRFRNGGTTVGVAGPTYGLDISQSGSGPAIRIGTSNYNADGLEIIPISGGSAAGIKIGTPTGFQAERGIEVYSNNHAVYGSSLSSVGGEFVGGTYGVDAKTRSYGAGSAIRGYNGAIGGEFTGSSYGVYAIGGNGSIFYDGSYGTYSYVSYPGYGIMTNGQLYTSNNVTAGGSMSVTGNAEVSGNTWGSAGTPNFESKYGGEWPNLGPTVGGNGNKCGSYVSSGDVFGATGWVWCPDGTYLAGLRKSSEKITNFMCCQL